MAAFLDLVADGKLDPSELITHSFPFAEAEQAFDCLQSEETTVGIVLRYGGGHPARPTTQAVTTRVRPARRGKPRLGLIGAGGFATATAIPGLVKAGFEPAVVASASGLSAENARRAFGFGQVLSNANEVILRNYIDLVAIVTQHNSHAALAAAALRAGKPVYVEKPLALSWRSSQMFATRRSPPARPSLSASIGATRHSPWSFATYPVRG